LLAKELFASNRKEFLEAEVYTSRNFRIQPGQVRGTFGPSPKFNFMYVSLTPPGNDFLSFQPE
jgi:hypothetical protein